MAADSSAGALIRRRLLVGTASNAVGRIVAMAVWFFLAPFMIGKLGPSQYGLWILVSSVVAYGSLMDFGMATAVIKYVAEFRARDDRRALDQLVATAVRLYSVVGLAAFGLSVLLAPRMGELFHLAPQDQPTAQALVVVTGAAFALGLAFTPTSAILRGLHRFDLDNVVSIVGSLVGALGTVVVLSAGGGLVPMVAINIPLTIAMRLVAVRLIRRAAPEMAYRWRGASRGMLRLLAGYGSAMFMGQVSGQLQKKTDEIVIGAVLVVSAITPYSLAAKLSGAAALLTEQFVRVLLPLASELDAQRDREGLRDLYVMSSRITTAMVVVLGLPLLLLPGQILTAWVGAAYASSAPLVIVLTVATMINMPLWPAAAILQGTGRFRVLVVSALATGIANLVLSIILARSIGVMGVALGTLIPTVVESLVIVLPYTLWRMKVGPARLLGSIIVPALLPAIPMAGLVFALGQALAPLSLLGIALVSAVGALVYVVAYLTLGPTQPERQMVKTLVAVGHGLLVGARP